MLVNWSLMELGIDWLFLILFALSTVEELNKLRNNKLPLTALVGVLSTHFLSGIQFLKRFIFRY